MAYSSASGRATVKHIKNNYDTLLFRGKKGQKEALKEYAESKGISLRQLIILSIEEYAHSQGVNLSINENSAEGEE